MYGKILRVFAFLSVLCQSAHTVIGEDRTDRQAEENRQPVAQAQHPSALSVDESVLTAPEVFVSATRSMTTVGALKESVTIMTAAQLRQQVLASPGRSLGQILPKLVPGMAVGHMSWGVIQNIRGRGPCNMGCPNCPYTDTNSELRRFYHEHNGDLIPVKLWEKIADECGPYGAWMRCTGGGEPMLHPQMVEMIEYAKARGARVWLNTNGSMFGPTGKHRQRLERVIRAGIDLIEFSMDAADAQTYAVLRPPRSGKTGNPEQWWEKHMSNVRAALDIRKELVPPTRVVTSIIRQEAIDGRLDEAVQFW